MRRKRRRRPARETSASCSRRPWMRTGGQPRGGDGATPEAPGRGAAAGELITQALAGVAPRAEGAKEKPSEVVASGGQDAG